MLFFTEIAVKRLRDMKLKVFLKADNIEELVLTEAWTHPLLFAARDFASFYARYYKIIRRPQQPPDHQKK